MNHPSRPAVSPDRFQSRCQLMIDVTYQTLRCDPQLRLCEGLRLIEAARTAVARFEPAAVDALEQQIIPAMQRTLMERFGVPDSVVVAQIN